MKKFFWIAGILVLVSVTALVFHLANNKKEVVKDNIRFAKEYDISKNNQFVYRTSQEIINILERGTGIVYLGFPECPWCQAYVKILNESAKENGLEKIYYLNIKEERANNTKNYQKIVEILKEYLGYDDEGNPRVYVPDVTIVKNGEIVGHCNETSMISGEITPEEYWTEEAVKALKEELSEYFSAIQNTTCTDVCDK